MLGFNDTSTLVGHFVSAPRERDIRDRIVEEMKEREGRKREMKESDGTEEITTLPCYPYPLQGQQAFPICKPILVGRPI